MFRPIFTLLLFLFLPPVYPAGPGWAEPEQAQVVEAGNYIHQVYEQLYPGRAGYREPVAVYKNTPQVRAAIRCGDGEDYQTLPFAILPELSEGCGLPVGVYLLGEFQGTEGDYRVLAHELFHLVYGYREDQFTLTGFDPYGASYSVLHYRRTGRLEQVTVGNFGRLFPERERKLKIGRFP